MTLFEKYGGFSTVSKIIHQFYRDVLVSPTLKPYFNGIDISRIIDHQTKFISHALGGPTEYTGRSLGVSHRHLNITKDAFEEVNDILEDTLEDVGMEEADIIVVMGIVRSTYDAIVTKG
jgi:hemoglobin